MWKGGLAINPLKSTRAPRYLFVAALFSLSLFPVLIVSLARQTLPAEHFAIKSPSEVSEELDEHQFLPLVSKSRSGTTVRVSIASDGSQSNGGSLYPSISAHGRYVAFISAASNLVSGDTNRLRDIFVHDQDTRTTTLVSVASDGSQSLNGAWGRPSISADGRYVAFVSTDLVSGQIWDSIFVHDREARHTDCVSVASDGTEANGACEQPSVSAHGRYIAFRSWASNLVSNDTNECYEFGTYPSQSGDCSDVFVHDRHTDQTTRVSVASGGTQANSWSRDPSISADGRYVAFESSASNLVQDDTNGTWDVFVHDRHTNQTTRVSVASNGAQGNSYSGLPSISADGRYVAFWSGAANLVPGDTNGFWDIFVHDRDMDTTKRVSIAYDGAQGDQHSSAPSISANGQYVAFWSHAENLVVDDNNNDLDIFVHDCETLETALVSVATDGSQAYTDSWGPRISADGRYVTFFSDARNLVNGDTNHTDDVFVRDRGATSVRIDTP